MCVSISYPILIFFFLVFLNAIAYYILFLCQHLLCLLSVFTVFLSFLYPVTFRIFFLCLHLSSFLSPFLIFFLCFLYHLTFKILFLCVLVLMWYSFLHGSWYGTMFWVCAENSVDNTGMFSLLLSSAYTESRPFLLPTPPASRLGVHKELGGDTAGTADPNCPKGHSIP